MWDDDGVEIDPEEFELYRDESELFHKLLREIKNDYLQQQAEDTLNGVSEGTTSSLLAKYLEMVRW